MQADLKFHPTKHYVGMFDIGSRYNWSDPIVAVFNQRLNRSLDIEHQPDLIHSALNNTFMKCYYKEKKMNCFDLFQVVMTDAGNNICDFAQ